MLNFATGRRAGTWGLAGGGAAVCLAMVITGIVLQANPGETTLLGMPVGVFLAILVLPLALGGLVIASVRAQERIDRLPLHDERD